jgi:predicted AlkP superfamily phosphohydrolase/phosphomutase
MGRPELTIIGLDAATFDVIDPMIEAGELPNLKRVFDQGSRGVLRSTTHPLTTQAWTTMLTGVKAGRHGMWDFTERDETGYHLRLVNGSFRRAPAIWELLSATGRRVGVINVPFTWPAQELNGFFIAGLDAAAREYRMTYPESLAADMRDRYRDLLFDHGPQLDKDGYVDPTKMRATIEQKLDCALWLSERFDPELLLVVFMAADHMQHYGWIEWEEKGLESRVAEVYRGLDDAVGSFLEFVGPDRDVLVVSDHGAGRMKGVVNLNAWLAQHGWLTYTDDVLRMGPREMARMALYKLFEQRRKLPQGLRNFAKQRAPKLRERAYVLREFTAIDFKRSRAFAYGNMGNVVVNVRGREKDGTVEPGEEYEELRTAIAEQARELADPETGAPLVKAVHRREDLFEGPEIGRLPDLIFEFDRYAWGGKGNLMKRTPTIWDEIKMPDSGKDHYIGTHRHEGIVAFMGPSATHGEIVGANIEDVAPTAMYLLGEPIPVEFEGRLLVEAIDPARLDAQPPDYAERQEVALQSAQGYRADDLGEVEGRLRDLGYIE